MAHLELDEVDRGILHMLQEDARNSMPADIAEAVGVAPNTVRNRLERLENEGIIKGYHPHIDYERAGYQLHVLFVCSIPVSERRETAEKALTIEGVVQVNEILSGRNNVLIEVVGENSDDLTTVATRIEQLGCTIEDEWFLKDIQVQPFDKFGSDQASTK